MRRLRSFRGIYALNSGTTVGGTPPICQNDYCITEDYIHLASRTLFPLFLRAMTSPQRYYQNCTRLRKRSPRRDAL